MIVRSTAVIDGIDAGEERVLKELGTEAFDGGVETVLPCWSTTVPTRDWAWAQRMLAVINPKGRMVSYVKVSLVVEWSVTLNVRFVARFGWRIMSFSYPIFALLALPLLGHDLYLMPRQFRPEAGSTITIAFHNGDDFPDPDRAPKVENLIDVSLHGAKGVTPMRNLRTEGKVLLADVTVVSGSSLLSVRTKPNFIELQPLKFEDYLRHEGLTRVLRWRAEHSESDTAGRERYSKYVKSLVVAGAATGFYNHPVGYPIEIVPMADPAALKVGAELPIQVLFRGKPAADLQIEMAWLPANGKATRQAAGRTDGQGRLRIPIGSTGIWKLHTVMMERCAEPSVADWESFWASFTFEVR